MAGADPKFAKERRGSENRAGGCRPRNLWYAMAGDKAAAKADKDDKGKQAEAEVRQDDFRVDRDAQRRVPPFCGPRLEAAPCGVDGTSCMNAVEGRTLIMRRPLYCGAGRSGDGKLHHAEGPAPYGVPKRTT